MRLPLDCLSTAGQGFKQKVIQSMSALLATLVPAPDLGNVSYAVKVARREELETYTTSRNRFQFGCRRHMIPNDNFVLSFESDKTSAQPLLGGVFPNKALFTFVLHLKLAKRDELTPINFCLQNTGPI